MNESLDKELRLAIEDYELYPVWQRKILVILLSVEVDNIASVTVDYLTKAVKYSRTSIWAAIKQLEKDKFIKRIRIQGTRHNSFELNKSKLNQILKVYRSKKEFV